MAGRDDTDNRDRENAGPAKLGDLLDPKMREEMQRRAQPVVSVKNEGERQKRDEKPSSFKSRQKDRRSRKLAQVQRKPGAPAVRKQERDEYEGVRIVPPKPRSPRPEEAPYVYWRPTRAHDVPFNVGITGSAISESDISGLLTLGAAAHHGSGEKLDATIGLDFGTSSSKIIVRLPYEQGEPSYAIEVPPPMAADGNPHLWATFIWESGEGQFSLWPKHGWQRHSNIKLKLMESSDLDGAGDRLDDMIAAVAHLAFIIRYVCGWMIARQEAAFIRRQPIWSLNVGLPAANYDNASMLKCYRRVVAAAFRLAKSGDDITRNSISELLQYPAIRAASETEDATFELGIRIVPEVAAEVVGFAKSDSSVEGLYLLIDVGAATLDVCAFNLRRQEGQERYDLPVADVQVLGAAALNWAKAEGYDETRFEADCRYLERAVVWATKKKKYPHADAWKKSGQLTVFFCGGGIASNLHQRVTEGLGDWLRQHAHNDGIRLMALEKPTSLSMKAQSTQFHRMAIAWGLSYPAHDIGIINRPSDIADVDPPGRVDHSDRYTSKDLT